MNHAELKIVQHWTSRASADHEDNTDLMHRCEAIQKGLAGHFPVIMPILADLHILADIQKTKIVNRFFNDEKKTKGEAKAELDTWEKVQQQIESIIPTSLKKEFNDVRRSRIYSPNT